MTSRWIHLVELGALAVLASAGVLSFLISAALRPRFGALAIEAFVILAAIWGAARLWDRL